MPTLLTASRIADVIILFELIASFPPRRITVFPDLRQRAAASLVTFGLASNITAITPKGTETFSILRPLGLTVVFKILPTGSGSFTISSTPFAIPFILSALSISLSRIPSDKPFFFPFSKSIALASTIFSVLSIKALAIAVRILFFSSVVATLSLRSASFAFTPNSSNIS